MTLAAQEMRPIARSVAELRQAIVEKRTRTFFDLTATLTQFTVRNPAGTLTVQDGDGVWFNNHSTNTTPFALGDRVRVSGKLTFTDGGLPSADCFSLVSLGPAELPAAVDFSASRLAEISSSHRLVRVSGNLMDTFRDEIDGNWHYLVLRCEGATVYAVCKIAADTPDFRRLLGADIAITGVFNTGGNNRRCIGDILYFHSADFIETLRVPSASLFDVEDIRYSAPLDRQPGDATVKRRADGFVLAVWDRNRVLLRTDDGMLVQGELGGTPPKWGERIRLVGFPETDLYIPILSRAIWRHEPADRCPEMAAPVDTTVLRLHANDPTFRQFDFSCHGRTVRLAGVVRGLPIENEDGRLYLESDAQLVVVDVGGIPSATDGLAVGFGLEVSGVCIMETEKMGPNRLIPHVSGFRIVPRTAADIRIVSYPPWWTTARLLSVIGSLLLALAGILVWTFALRRLAEKRGRELSREQLARIESELKVRERTRLSVELHDTLSQNLIGAAMEINTVEQLVDDGEARKHLNIASKTLKSTRDELRNCLWDLRSRALEESEMDEAIRKTLAPYIADVDLQVRFNVPRDLFTDHTAHELMRVIRELVLNAIRHGRATSVKVAGSLEDGRLLFSVRDDGGGFDPSAVPGIAEGHFGLQGVRERIRLLHGKVSIASETGKGTRVSASFELPRLGGMRA